MKRIVLGLVLILSGIQFYAQQDAMYSQYMFNPFAVNPAYAGSRSSLSGVVLGRKQWAGINGAPTTGTFAIHSPFKGKNFALGFNAIVDKIGPSTNTGALATYAYHLKLGPGKLSLGLRGGVYSNRLDKSALIFDDGTDVNNTGGYLQKIVPTFDFGGYYYTEKFYVGLSSNHIITSGTTSFDSIVNNSSNVFSTFDRHFMLATGYAYAINPDVVLKPSLLVKYVHGAPVNVDINMSVLLKKLFWVGISVRSSKDIVAVLEYNFSNSMRIGYSYDFSFGPVRTYTTGSHEIFLGFDLDVSRKQGVSPRYL
ncbi:MAG: type IX secretion system membrane protein PorP/SprF [Flavobacteriales bacterium]|nr:type IX secretion system membrane protein PorP/SprF [Flavobacteriales bacterium]